jgi:hypothetical protein
MARRTIKEERLNKDLGGGFVLRQASREDAERLVAFNTSIHRHDDTNEPDERVGAWTRDLLKKPHPTTQASDFTLVEDAQSGSIVSSLVMISQTWAYSGRKFKVGRPELVGTDPNYRNRGLIRAQFDVIHEWSQRRGELLQAITGIPYYYRLFGYEMALDLGGGRAGYKTHIPKLEEDQSEPFHIRPADETDLSLLVKLDAEASKRYLVSCVRDEGNWQYELMGKSRQNVQFSEIKIIEDENKTAIGYLAHPPNRWGDMMAVTTYELSPEYSWANVTPSVIRYIQSIGEKIPTADGKDKTFESFGFWLGRDHPVYTVIPDKLPRVREPYAWFLRLPDPRRFIQHIAPALEEKLAASPFAGHSGELKITFYRTGLKMAFDTGSLVKVEDWQPEPNRYSGDAGFPGLVFTQLVFGYRNISELKYAFADCWTKDDRTSALLESLFPKQVSGVWPLS